MEAGWPISCEYIQALNLIYHHKELFLYVELGPLNRAWVPVKDFDLSDHHRDVCIYIYMCICVYMCIYAPNEGVSDYHWVRLLLLLRYTAPKGQSAGYPALQAGQRQQLT